MKQKLTQMLLILILVFGAAEIFTHEAESAPEKIKIGVVNVNAVFEGYSLTAEFEKQINREFEEKMKIYKELNEDIRTAQDEMELFEKGSQKWQEKNKELQQKIFHAAFFEKWEKQQFNDKLKNLTTQIYRDVSDAIEEYAKKRAYTLILKTEALELKSESRTELKLKINNKKVMFYKKSYDVTNEIIELLNK